MRSASAKVAMDPAPTSAAGFTSLFDSPPNNLKSLPLNHQQVTQPRMDKRIGLG
jgi:hypothetical protein